MKFRQEVAEIEWDDIDSDFLYIQPPEVDWDAFRIEDIILNYDDDGETAFYDVKVSANTFPIHISRTESDGGLWIADVELALKLTLQVQRDLRNLDEDSISYQSFTYEIITIRDAWEVVQERELDAWVEADAFGENYYNF